MDQIKRVILRALAQSRGDDFERAQLAFGGLSPEEMQQQYGRSGKTRYQLLDEYRQHAEEVDRATQWVRENL